MQLAASLYSSAVVQGDFPGKNRSTLSVYIHQRSVVMNLFSLISTCVALCHHDILVIILFCTAVLGTWKLRLSLVTMIQLALLRKPNGIVIFVPYTYLCTRIALSGTKVCMFQSLHTCMLLVHKKHGYKWFTCWQRS